VRKSPPRLGLGSFVSDTECDAKVSQIGILLRKEEYVCGPHVVVNDAGSVCRRKRLSDLHHCAGRRSVHN
jgi:hypothetical protein